MAEKPKTVEELTAEVATLTKRATDAETALAAATAAPSKPEDIEKNLPEPVKALLAKAREDAAAAAAVNKANDERIAKLEAERDRGQMIATCSVFKALGAVEDLTGLMLPIKKSVPAEIYDKLVAKMKGWDEVARQSKLFQEVGTSADGTIDPEAQLNVLAKAHQAAHPDLTPEMAYSAVLQSTDGKALYKASQLAKRGGK